ncbi:hypothetical protein IX307_001379 [Bacteroides pyogenes]|uniref:hypothetical protein n=1 Tax=Bacteroides pyogenes TaxID=310300 RepID=UPI001BA95C62|nr:hypothetical protein [Bacteroides pyogenes]MBR8720197.1 hypothetical protein [Bacteroides pyogenes]MBR8726261.1 hypothetical protein [Bacteroides pyogenes]MBR8740109.1 hypothetical protein [Bacteroides pyogenes]MBR8755857.1 hypothetical protein [Bacteroides pyogenes]MBR8787058.1 hypothetical protein [Bacteroides pyogenes]
MKSNYLTLIAIVAAILFMILFGFSEYSNVEMRRQIQERDAYIKHIDTLIGLYSNVEFKDSIIVFRFPVDQYGNKLKFDDLDSIRRVNELIIQTQDMVIREAKKLYKFNYSTKVIGDSIRVRIWDK